jgi:hypothetical protein
LNRPTTLPEGNNGKFLVFFSHVSSPS